MIEFMQVSYSPHDFNGTRIVVMSLCWAFPAAAFQ